MTCINPKELAEHQIIHELLEVGSGTDENAIHDNVASEINSIAEKVTPLSTDLVIIEDSGDSYNKKKIQVGNLPGGGGGLTIVNGYPVFNDPTRSSKQLSIARANVWGSKRSRARNTYLRVGDAATLISTGWRLPLDATLTMASVQLSDSATVDIQVRKNDSTTPVHTISVTAALGTENTTVDVDFSAGDFVQLYVDGTCRNPLVLLEFAWRP